jgi:hypothetical protein
MEQGSRVDSSSRVRIRDRLEPEVRSLLLESSLDINIALVLGELSKIGTGCT